MRHSFQQLSLFQFKNYAHAQFDFSSRLICISGENGSGKTTLLDAIYYLCFTKSYFTHIDANLAKHNENSFRISSLCNENIHHEVACILRESGKKEFSFNGEIYMQLSKHIGKISAVMIAPDDVQLIMDGAETRRKFIDSMIAQIDGVYMQNMLIYAKNLAQRNSYLKQLEGKINLLNTDLLDIYNQELIRVGNYIFDQRCKFIEILKPKVQGIYAHLSNAKESIDITYQSTLHHEAMQTSFNKNIEKDVYSQRTNAGIHKDDLIFSLEGMMLKQVASQGQRKSFLFGLKLAQFEMIYEFKQCFPILLLDDIFEKIDSLRTQKLIKYILKTEAQVFVTDTHETRLQEAFKQSNEVQMIKL
jgi:DNA replication and repair protein RecF